MQSVGLQRTTDAEYVHLGLRWDGNVIVTKIGIQEFYDVKAFGDCVNKASKYSNGCNQVKVSKQVKEIWPSSEGGKIKFMPSDGVDCYILS